MSEPVDGVVIHRENAELTIRITPHMVRVQVEASTDPQRHEDEKVQRKRARTRKKSSPGG